MDLKSWNFRHFVNFYEEKYEIWLQQLREKGGGLKVSSKQYF